MLQKSKRNHTKVTDLPKLMQHLTTLYITVKYLYTLQIMQTMHGSHDAASTIRMHIKFHEENILLLR